MSYVAYQAGLADGFDEGLVEGEFGPGCPAVLARRQGPHASAIGPAALASPVVAHVDQEGSVVFLDHLAFVRVGGHGGAELPGLPVIVAIHDVRILNSLVALLAAALSMVAGDNQAPLVGLLFKLNSDPGTGCHPGPVGFLDVGGDIDRV